MDKFQLKSLKNKYFYLKEYIKQLKKLESEINELENSYIIKEYLYKKEKYEKMKKNYDYSYITCSESDEYMKDDEIIINLVDKTHIVNPDSIYVFIGISDNEKERLNCKKYIFKNIETQSKKCIEEEQLKQFEEENIVIYPNKDDNNIDFYERCRNNYLKNLFKRGNKEANKILIKNNRSCL